MDRTNKEGRELVMKIKLSEIPEEKSLDDYPDDTIIVFDEKFPRYILDPFRIVFPGDKDYDTALTREEVMKMTDTNE